MTAEIVELFPTGGHADDTIRRTIRALMKGKGVTPDQLAQAANMSRATFYNHMAGKGAQGAFKAGEVADIARFLGVEVGRLYDGLGGTFVPPTPPDGGECPGRESNSRPFAYKVRLASLSAAA